METPVRVEVDVAGCLGEALRTLLASQPGVRVVFGGGDVAVIDASSGENGLDAPCRLGVSGPNLVLFTGAGLSRSTDEAEGPACVQVDRSDSTCELLEGIRRAARGEAYCSSSLRAEEAAALTEQPRAPVLAAALLAVLTRTEREAVRLALERRTNRQIAEAMFVTIFTVKRHLWSAYLKLGVDSRGELSALASAHGGPMDPPSTDGEPGPMSVAQRA